MKRFGAILLVAVFSFGAAVVARAEEPRYELPPDIGAAMMGVQVNIAELAAPESSLALMEFFDKPGIEASVRRAAAFAMCEREQLLGRVYSAQRGIVGISPVDFEGRHRAVKLLHMAVQELDDSLTAMETGAPEFHAFFRAAVPAGADTFQRLKKATEVLMKYATGCRGNIVKDSAAGDGAEWKLWRRR